MDGPRPIDPAETAARRQAKKQRALNALVFLLVAAVCVQAYVLWETNQRLNSTAAELESVRKLADTSDWKTIPKPAEADQPAPPAAPDSDPFARFGLQSWDPFADMDRIRDEMDRLMGQARAHGTLAPQVGGVLNQPLQQRQVHVAGDGDAYVVRASLPGVDEADISVHVEKQLLSICVKQDRAVDGGASANQRMSGQCTHRVTLPEAVDGAAMRSTFRDGVLTVVIPKAGRASRGTDSGPSQSVRH